MSISNPIKKEIKDKFSNRNVIIKSSFLQFSTSSSKLMLSFHIFVFHIFALILRQTMQHFGWEKAITNNPENAKT